MEIKELTKGCPRADCRISFHGSMTTTLAFSPSYYDKYGNFIDSPDPNTVTSNYHCNTCGKQWTVSKTNGIERVTEF